MKNSTMEKLYRPCNKLKEESINNIHESYTSFHHFCKSDDYSYRDVSRSSSRLETNNPTQKCRADTNMPYKTWQELSGTQESRWTVSKRNYRKERVFFFMIC